MSMSYQTIGKTQGSSLTAFRCTADRDEVQKKTFTKWINSHLIKAGVQVEDLYEDLRDGQMLMLLLEMFTGEKLRKEKGRMRVHKLQNLNTVLAFLERKKIETVNISSEHILDGNPKLTLGLVWRLILHFQLSSNTEEKVNLSELKAIILDWCRKVTDGYEGADVTNFTTSWKSGLALNAIINRFRPDLINYDALNKSNPEENLEKAFSVAAKELAIPRLLDVSDLAMASPDENSVLTYVSFFVKAFSEDIPPKPKQGNPAEGRWKEYADVANPLMDWIRSKLQWLEDHPVSATGDLVKAKEFEQELSSFQEGELNAQSAEKDKAKRLFEQFEDANAKINLPIPVEDGLHLDDVCKAWDQLQQASSDRLQAQKEYIASLEKESAVAAILDKIRDCKEHLGDLEKRVNEFQAEAGKPSSRDDMNSTADRLAGESQAVKNELSSLATQLAGLTEQTAELEKPLALCDKLAGQLTASSDAIGILRDVDQVLDISVEDVKEKKEPLQKSIEKLKLDHEKFLSKHASLENTDPHGLVGQLAKACSHWESVCAQYGEELRQPVESFNEWLKGVEENLLSQTAMFYRYETVKTEQHQPLKELADSVHARKEEYTAVMALSGDVEDNETASLIIGLSERWSAVQTEVDRRVEHIASGGEKLKRYEDELHPLGNWLAWAEGELDTLRHRENTSVRVQEQVDKCEKLLSDIKAHEPYMESTSSRGQDAVHAGERWQELLDDFNKKLGKMKGVPSFEEVMEREYNKEDHPIATEAVPEELKKVDKRYEDLLKQFERRLGRLRERLEKAKHVESLFDRVVAFLKGSESLGFDDKVPAGVGTVEPFIEQIQEWQPGWNDHDALLKEALAAQKEFLTGDDSDIDEGQDEPDRPDVVSRLTQQLHGLRKRSEDRKQRLIELKDQSESFNRENVSLLYAMAGVESAEKQQKPPSLDDDILLKQIKEQEGFHSTLLGNEPSVEKIKQLARAVLANPMATEESKEKHQQQLAEVLNCFGHAMLSSAARQKQLARTHAQLKQFKELWSPFSGQLSRLEEQLIICGPSAVDKPTLEEQMAQVEENQKIVENMQGQLEDVILAGQQLLMTCYMGEAKRSEITSHLGESKEKEEDEMTNLQPEANEDVSGNQSFLPSGEVPPDRFVVQLRTRKKKDEVDLTTRTLADDKAPVPMAAAVPTVDVLQMAKEAVEASTANWVQAECVTLPERMPKLKQACQKRIDHLLAMQRDVDCFETSASPLEAWLSASEKKTRNIHEQKSVSQADLEKQLDEVKKLLKEINEKEADIESAVSAGQGLIETHDIDLGELQEQLAQLAATQGRSINDLCSSPLDQTTAPGVEELKKRLEDLERQLSTLRKDLAVCAADCEASLAAAKDAGNAIASLCHDLDRLDNKLAGLQPVAADRETLEKQTDEQKDLDIEASSLQAKLAALREKLADKLDPKGRQDLNDASTRCQAHVDLLAERQSALANADQVVSKMEDLDAWLSQQEAYLEALPADCSRPQLEEFRANVGAKSDDFKGVEADCTSITDTFAQKVDGNAFSTKSAALMDRLNSLQTKVKNRLSSMEEDEAEAERLDAFRQLSKPFVAWMEDMESANGQIGLTYESVNDLTNSLQRLSDAVAGKREELDRLFDAASAVSATTRNGDDDSDSANPAIKEGTALKERFEKLASLVGPRLEKVNVALGKAEEFEQPFSDHTDHLVTFEKEMDELTKPITGILEESEQQLQTFKDLQEKIAVALPSVHKVCNTGNEFEQLSEVDDAEKEEFHQNVENLRTRWEELQQRCVNHVDQLSQAVEETGNFLDNHLNPLLEWMNEVDVLVSPDYPVGGDKEAVESIKEQLEAVRADCSQREDSFALAKTTGESLMAKVLDEPTVTEEQLSELQARWEALQVQLTNQEKRLAEAEDAASRFDNEYNAINTWLESAETKLSSMEGVSHDDISVLEDQDQEMQDFNSDMDENLPQLEGVIEKGKALLESSPPGRCEELKAKLAALENRRTKLTEAAHDRTVEIEAALLALRGLRDAVKKASDDIERLEQEMNDQEAAPVGENIGDVTAQLKELQALQQSVDAFQPQLDALMKVRNRRLQGNKESAEADPQMQAIAELSEHAAALRDRIAARQEELEDALQHLEEATADNFDIEKWRKGFVSWMDDNNIQLREIFATFDADKSQKLSREEFIDGLAACGYTIPRAHLNKLADYFDKDEDREIDYLEFATGLRPERQVVFKHKARTDEEAVAQAVKLACAQCTCPKQFEIKEVSKGCYRFGESHMKRLIRILQTRVMVRVGGGWDDLESFVRKHDPCRAASRSNVRLLNLPVLKRGTAMADIDGAGSRTLSSPIDTEKTVAGQKGSDGHAASSHAHHSGRCQVHENTPPATSPMSASTMKSPMANGTASPMSVPLSAKPKGTANAGQKSPGSRPKSAAAPTSGRSGSSTTARRPHTATVSSTQKASGGAETAAGVKGKSPRGPAAPTTANSAKLSARPTAASGTSPRVGRKTGSSAKNVSDHRSSAGTRAGTRSAPASAAATKKDDGGQGSSAERSGAEADGRPTPSSQSVSVDASSLPKDKTACGSSPNGAEDVTDACPTSPSKLPSPTSSVAESSPKVGTDSSARKQPQDHSGPACKVGTSAAGNGSARTTSARAATNKRPTAANGRVASCSKDPPNTRRHTKQQTSKKPTTWR